MTIYLDHEKTHAAIKSKLLKKLNIVNNTIFEI